MNLSPPWLKEEPWLSACLHKPVFRIEPQPHWLSRQSAPYFAELQALEPWLQSSPLLLFIKIPSDALPCQVYFQRLGFLLIDTALTFEKPINPPVGTHPQIRPAQVRDEAQVAALAANNFVYSRFHLDPLIRSGVADRLKERWASNYFHGQRGDSMLVYEAEGRIAGFLQLLEKPQSATLVIDLIAVDQAFRGQQVAASLIQEAEKQYAQFKLLRVGTQAANIPSIRLYEKLGFRMIKSEYVLHYHH